VATGGPLGSGDAYLACYSNGTAGAGGKQVMNNTTQWLFDFSAAGVTEIQFYARTSYATPLPLRACLDGAGGKICASTAVTLPNDGLWHLLTVGVNAADFSLAGGTNVSATLASPTMFRLESNPAAVFGGSQIAATVDYDKITYITQATSTVTPSPSGTASFSPTASPSATRSPTPSPTGSPTATGTASPTVSASPTPSATVSPTHTSSPTPSGTPTFSWTPSLTFTPSATPTLSATFSQTPTPSDSPTSSATPSVSPTFSASPSYSASPTISPTFTISPTWTPTPLSPSAPKAVVGPVPGRVGSPLCAGAPSPPLSVEIVLKNLSKEPVATVSGGAGTCLDTALIAPGMYFAVITVRYPDGTSSVNEQKLTILARK
jgi:hypothetical protein